MNKTYIGGQAVVEGVMMRGKTLYALAVRTPDHTLCVEKKPIEQRFAFRRIPILRGIFAFFDSLVIGMQVTMRSAELAGEEEEDPSRFEQFLEKKCGKQWEKALLYGSVALSLVFSILLFILLPVWLGSLLKGILPGTWALGIAEGCIRIGIFLLYLALVSKLKEMHRIFQYHGAEHKTINCLEQELPLTVENVRNATRLHKRCGTSFLLIVMVMSMVVFFFVQTDQIWLRLMSRLLLVPLIAGLSYELIRWAGSSDSKWVNLISYPGMCLQKLTTAEPDDSQIETAIAAMEAVLEEEPEEAAAHRFVKTSKPLENGAV